MTLAPKSSSAKWLLMIHQLPAKPAYARIKIGRKLQTLGAVAVKNAVYALPVSAVSTEAYKTLATDITRDGGEALVCEANFIAGLSDVEIRALFDLARDTDYEKLTEEGRALLRTKKVTPGDLRRLQKHRDEIAAIDFFGAHGRQSADNVLADITRRLAQHMDVSRVDTAPKVTPADLKNRVWVTRRHIHVDRIASAWLIRRFIDPTAKLKFDNIKTYKFKRRELRYDMAGAEFTHEGNNCTFETLLERAELSSDPALRAVADIIHDLDIDDGKFARPETAGFGAMIGGVCATSKDDQERLSRGSAGLDQFYAYFTKSR